MGTIAALVTASSALIVAIATYRSKSAEARHDHTVASQAVTTTMLSLLKPLSERVEALEGEVATLRKRVAEFRRGVRLLCGQIVELGGKPVWLPDEDE